MFGAASIARANARALANHLRISLGMRSAPVVAGVTAALTALAFAWLSHNYLQQNLAGIFLSTQGVDPRLEVARTAILQAPPLSAGAIALILAVFTAAESSISVVARVNGASRRAISLGEFVPIIVCVAAAALGSGLGPAMFAASQQRAPLVTLAALLALGVFYSAVILLAFRLGALAGDWLRVGPLLSKLLGVFIGFVVEALALANLLMTVIHGTPSVATRICRLLWLGRDIPTTPPTAIVTVAAASAVLLLVLGLLALPPSHDSLRVPHRIASVSSLHLPRWLDAVAREILLTLRHPASQFSLALSVLLGGLVVTAAWNYFIPRALSLYFCAILFSSAGETIHGRSLPWNWHYRTGGSMPRSRILVQYSAALATALPLSAIAVLACGVGLDVSAWRVVPFAVMLSAAALVSGIIIPYAASAPSGMFLTSVLAVTLEMGCVLVTTLVIPPDGVISIVVDLVLAAVLFLLGIFVAQRGDRWRQRA